MLHGAVTHPGTGAPAFGAGEHRLAAVAAALTGRLGAARFAAATQRGRALAAVDVVAFARAEIDHALRSRHAS